MNEVLKKLDQFPEGVRVSLFLEWKSVNHTFEEVRIWLDDIVAELEEKKRDVPPKITEILEDQRVFGSELNLNKKLPLGERYGAFYFAGDRVLAVDTALRCKDQFFIDDEFMVLPLLKSNQNLPVLVLLVRQEMVKVYKVSNYHLITDITENFQFPDLIRELGEFEQKGIMDSRFKEEAVKKYAGEIAAEVSKTFNSFNKVHVFSSEKIGHFFKRAIEKINKKVKVQTHAYVPFDVSERAVHDLLREKVVESENIQDFGESVNFKSEPVTDLKEIIWDQEMGNLRGLMMNQEWLENALGSGENQEQLKTLNRFVRTCLRAGVKVGLSRDVQGLFAGELHGPRVRPPSTFDFSPYENMETILS